ncbi:DUF4256 domain-containing protein [Candidatus Gracilibacteria bacterium]|nr:DUF4256 domain-containing protein [Candidatus Gracilibacteria bacterium]
MTDQGEGQNLTEDVLEAVEEQATDEPEVDPVVENDTKTIQLRAQTATELTPEQTYLQQIKADFDSLPHLHPGVEWIDVEKSLQKDPESLRKLGAFNAKGHKMNVVGEENGEFIFVSAWSNYEEVSPDHRNITFDLEGQKLAESKGYRPIGNAVSIIANIMGVKEDEARNYLADLKFYEQLDNAIDVKGGAWLKTDKTWRERGDAYCASHLSLLCGSSRRLADYLSARTSFRAELRVKKAA